MRPLETVRLSAIVAMASAAVLGACDGPQGAFSLTATYASTVAARTAHVTVVFCLPRPSGHCEATPLSAQGVMELDGSAWSLQSSLGELEQVGGYLYESLSPKDHSPPEGVPADKTWVSIDLRKETNANAGQSTQPAALLERLRSGKGSGIQDLGNATISGAPTRRYRLRLTPAPGSTPGVSIASTVDLWVDSQGHIRRIVTDLPDSLTKLPILRETEDFSNFGVPVTVAPPPASATIDAASVACLRELYYQATGAADLKNCAP